jgi:hypothetical protein
VSATAVNPEATANSTPVPEPTGAAIWRALNTASFAVVSYVTPTGQPRSSGVVYTMIGRRMFVVVGVDSWKARHIARSGRVAVTVPVRRGGLMSLLFPIPPATISFHGAAVIHAAASPQGRRVLAKLARMLPSERQEACAIIEISPAGWFLTYGVGVPLMSMRKPERARARVPVA